MSFGGFLDRCPNSLPILQSGRLLFYKGEAGLCSDHV
jgi:hypothetical protein